MNSRITRALIVLTLMFSWLGYQASPAYALCSGSGCDGLNPNTLGCGADAVTSGSVKILSDGGTNQSFVETRKSSACNAKWARTTNKSGGSRYAAGSLRYGCTDYCNNRSVSSPGTISNNATVFTPMQGLIATPTRSCGIVSLTGPIAIPISISSTRCTGVN